MADPEEQVAPIEDDEPEETPGYKAPAQKSVDEIQKLDADDESLVRYKQALLGSVNSGGEIVVAYNSSTFFIELKSFTDPHPAINVFVLEGDAGGPNVVVEKMSVIIDGRPDIDLDLTGDLTELTDRPITIKEGTSYKIKITFKVNREIVAGLKYHQVTTRKGIRVDKSSVMVGSYGPKAEAHEHCTPSEEAPKGLIARGAYVAKSKFIDDDKNIYLEWQWAFQIKKDWD